MNVMLRKRLELAVRVRDVLRFYKTDGVGEGLGLGRLEELIERAQVLAAQERAHVRLARGTHYAFLSAARRMLDRATLQKELLEDLAAALGEFEKTLATPPAGRPEQLGVSAELLVVADQIAEQVRALDRLVRYRFRDNAALIGTWGRAAGTGETALATASEERSKVAQPA